MTQRAKRAIRSGLRPRSSRVPDLVAVDATVGKSHLVRVKDAAPFHVWGEAFGGQACVQCGIRQGFDARRRCSGKMTVWVFPKRKVSNSEKTLMNMLNPMLDENFDPKVPVL